MLKCGYIYVYISTIYLCCVYGIYIKINGNFAECVFMFGKVLELASIDIALKISIKIENPKYLSCKIRY